MNLPFSLVITLIASLEQLTHLPKKSMLLLKNLVKFNGSPLLFSRLVFLLLKLVFSIRLLWNISSIFKLSTITISIPNVILKYFRQNFIILLWFIVNELKSLKLFFLIKFLDLRKRWSHHSSAIFIDTFFFCWLLFGTNEPTTHDVNNNKRD